MTKEKILIGEYQGVPLYQEVKTSPRGWRSRLRGLKDITATALALPFCIDPLTGILIGVGGVTGLAATLRGLRVVPEGYSYTRLTWGKAQERVEGPGLKLRWPVAQEHVLIDMRPELVLGVQKKSGVLGDGTPVNITAGASVRILNEIDALKICELPQRYSNKKGTRVLDVGQDPKVVNAIRMETPAVADEVLSMIPDHQALRDPITRPAIREYATNRMQEIIDKSLLPAETVRNIRLAMERGVSRERIERGFQITDMAIEITLDEEIRDVLGELATAPALAEAESILQRKLGSDYGAVRAAQAAEETARTGRGTTVVIGGSSHTQEQNLGAGAVGMLGDVRSFMDELRTKIDQLL